MTLDSVVSQRSLVELLEAERDHYKQAYESERAKRQLANADYDDLRNDIEVMGMELDRVNAELARTNSALDELGAGLVARRAGLVPAGGFDVNGLLQTLADEAGES